MHTQNFSKTLLQANEYKALNNEIVYSLDNQKILPEFEQLLVGSYYTPTLARFTEEMASAQLKKGMWLVANYDQPQMFAGYEFDTLIIQLAHDIDGLMIIRQLKGKTQDRAFYVTLNKTTNLFIDAINNLIK